MKRSLILNRKLNEISHILETEYKNQNDLGVVAGIAGLALFQFYYAKYLDVDKHADLGTEMISHCIEKINDGYSYPTFCSGIAGLGWAIQHLIVKDFIDVDCDELLPPFDDYLYNQMLFDLQQGNYDFLHGALGYGFYFLSRYEHTKQIDLKNKYKTYLFELLISLEKLSISDGKILKWESTLDMEKGNKGFNLSLSHGMSSILNFASRLHKFDDFKESTIRIINGVANYILSFENKNPDNLSLFPSTVENDIPLEYKSRVAWCYGDLGIGLSLLRAGKALNDTIMQAHALEILAHTTNRTLPDDTLVVDAGICHGSYGNALIFQKLGQNNSKDLFETSIDFWIMDGIQKAIFEDGYAGYKQWNGLDKNWTKELSLLEGVAGIGLVIIDYLSEEPNTWDECLMIS